MKSLRFALVICLAVAFGVYAGRLSRPLSVKAQGIAHVVRVSPGSSVSPAYGTPIALSCVSDTCYVLTSGN